MAFHPRMSLGGVKKQSKHYGYRPLYSLEESIKSLEVYIGQTVLQPVLLENEWTFWFDQIQGPCIPEEYMNSIKKLGSFASVQDFWRYFNFLPSADLMTAPSALHLMKKGVSPVWEDSENVEGGSLRFKVRYEESQVMWQQLALSSIGEMFTFALDAQDDINGVSVSKRKRDVQFTIWNKEASRIDVQKVIYQVHSWLPSIYIFDVAYKVHRLELMCCEMQHQPQGDSVLPKSEAASI